ncbi:MAG: class I SAM-dependent methyltransferase [Pseudonocardiaceae bacterium]
MQGKEGLQVVREGVAHRIERLVVDLLGAPLPVELLAWDGSRAGACGVPRVELRNKRALRHLLWKPGELGLARAYVSGDLVVHGDLTDGLRRCRQPARQHRPGSPPRVGPREWCRLIALAFRLGVVGPRPRPPATEARLSGKPHSRLRDRSAISHHYDASNDFYALLLDPRMTYSSGYWTSSDPGYGLAEAQEDKLDLICRKLGLREGMRLLDVGCGWGSLIIFAAQRYGVHATGVTLAAEQAAHIRSRVEHLGLRDRVQVRLQDYREITDEPFDAVASIEMGEHVGEVNYPIYAATLHRLLRPHGKLLLQQMSRDKSAPGGGAFIESYIAPDMSMVPLGRTLDHIHGAGLEVRDVESMREHYVPTVRAWLRTLEAHWDEAVALIGAEGARVWRLYLAGGALAFEENRMGVNQIVSVRPDDAGCTGLALADRVSVLGLADRAQVGP